MKAFHIPAHIAGVLFLIASGYLPASSLESTDANSEFSCGVEGFGDWIEPDYPTLEKSTLKLQGLSSEGGEATAYSRGNSVLLIESTLFGETGKTEITYRFHPANEDVALVHLSDYFYTVPIFMPESKIASVRKYEFVICGGQKPNYPDSSEIEAGYKRAKRVIFDIQKLL